MNCLELNELNHSALISMGHPVHLQYLYIMYILLRQCAFDRRSVNRICDVINVMDPGVPQSA